MLNDEMKLFVLFCVFLLGAYITSNTSSQPLLQKHFGSGSKEGFTGGAATANDSDAPTRCPNMLIQKGTSLFLYNTKLSPVPGVNPIRFENLEDYVEFMEWMRGQGIKCPILYLQHSLNTQGESIYSIRPSPTNLQGGLSPNIATAPSLFGGSAGRGSNDDASTMFSPEQISEITRIIDQSGDNDPYNASTYPGGWSNTIIIPADKASLMKIQSSYAASSGSGSSGSGNDAGGMNWTGTREWQPQPLRRQLRNTGANTTIVAIMNTQTIITKYLTATTCRIQTAILINFLIPGKDSIQKKKQC